MITISQGIRIILWVTALSTLGGMTGISFPYGGIVLHGVVVGAIMGDVSAGLYLGGTYELMNIGLNALGGTALPNYNLGVIVGVAFGAVTNVETGTAVGIVVATLSSALKVLTGMLGTFFLHKAQNLVEQKKLKKAVRWIRIGLLPSILMEGVIPLAILFLFGAAVVEVINNRIPDWLLTGFRNAGNMLPALGFATLLRSMKLKGNLQYLIIGFVLFAYLGVSALGVALAALALAMMYYYNNQKLADIRKAGGEDDE